jgi:hypothetical protein
MIATATPAEARPRELLDVPHSADVTLENYIGVESSLDRGPQAFRVNCRPGYVIRPHFHRIDQYQIFVAGGAIMGKHDCNPVTVHYTDAFTPYGPINCGPEGMSFFNLRSRCDVGAHYMPGSKDEMERRAGRGITASCRLTLDEGAGPMRYHALFGPCEDGLGASEVVCGPSAPIIDVVAAGSGRYQLVLEGSVVLDGKELGPGSVTFVPPGDVLAGRRAADRGVHLLEAQLPSL